VIEVDVVGANPQEMKGGSNIGIEPRRASIVGDLVFGRRCVSIRIGVVVVNGGSKFAAAICMTESIVDCKWGVQISRQVRNSYRAICPSAKAVYVVATIISIGNTMSARSIAVVAKIVTNATILLNGKEAFGADAMILAGFIELSTGAGTTDTDCTPVTKHVSDIPL